ncbi:MAG: DEAD/DEAH box helicase, partial [Phycisphaerae bacterium]
MIVLHATWFDGTLHLWGEQCAEGSVNRSPEGARRSARAEALGSTDTGSSTPLFPFAVTENTLRRSVGDLYDSLLVSGAVSTELTLRLPHAGGEPIPSWASRWSAQASSCGSPEALSLQACRVPTLAFSPADAVDLLTSSATLARDDIRGGASLRYWSRVAALVLELLAKQRFVPAIHHAGDDRYRGYWRVVVDDEETSERLGALIASMPPVCRSLAVEGVPVQASALVENFLWTTVDALVRRCLEGDELAHAIQERPEGTCSPQIRWLQSVVRSDPNLTGTSEERARTYETIQDWLAKLEPPTHERTCRTCFHLHPPPAVMGLTAQSSERTWRLTLHVQATQDRGMILDAASLFDAHGNDPSILRRPFANAREQLRADVGHAARYFPPLSACAETSGPLECRLTLEEAYSFLRDAAPILESEGFAVWVPKWWRADRPRLRMWLDLHPLDARATGGQPTMRLDALVTYDWRLAVGDEELSLEEISRLAAANEPLVRVRGRWTEVQPSDMQAALRFLKRNRGGKMTVFEALRQCYIADDLETGLPVAGLRAHGWIDNLLNATEVHERIEHFQPPSGFQGTLRPYQLRGMEWLSFLTRLGLGACLADDMGLGKTIQLIALWLQERESNRSPGPTLLVVPMSLVGNWQREIARFAQSLSVMIHHGMERLTGQEFVGEVGRNDVVISTYGLIHRDLEHLAAVEWHRIALDEAQNIKNPAAKQAVAIRSLKAVHRVALTGTPVENRLSDLWSILDFLNTGYLGGASDFRRRFAVPIERYHDTDRAQRLRHLIRPFVL